MGRALPRSGPEGRGQGGRELWRRRKQEARLGREGGGVGLWGPRRGVPRTKRPAWRQSPWHWGVSHLGSPKRSHLGALLAQLGQKLQV